MGAAVTKDGVERASEIAWHRLSTEAKKQVAVGKVEAALRAIGDDRHLTDWARWCLAYAVNAIQSGFYTLAFNEASSALTPVDQVSPQSLRNDAPNRITLADLRSELDYVRGKPA
jgi:hypothetical protein